MEKKTGEQKPPVQVIQYIDDKCICIKCGKRFNFSEVNYLIEKLDEKKINKTLWDVPYR